VVPPDGGAILMCSTVRNAVGAISSKPVLRSFYAYYSQQTVSMSVTVSSN